MPKPTNGDEPSEITKIGKLPLLTQVRGVARNPFVPESIEPRPDVQVALHADPTKEYVASGVMGYYPYLRALPVFVDDISQQFGLTVYERMLTDPVIYASERVYTLAILSNGWELIPSLSRDEKDYDESVKMRDFVQENLDNLETPYDVSLEQHLNAFEYGASVNEIVYYTDGGKLRLKDIREKPLINSVFVVDSYNNTVGILTQRFPGQIYPANSYIPIDFAMLDHPTRDGVTEKPNKNGEYDMSKRIPGFLPRDLFSVLTNEIRYNDERGHSGLRAAYSAWWFKQQIVAEYLSYLSKFGSPSLVGETAPGAVAQTYLDENGDPQLGTDGLPLAKTPEQVLSEALADFQNGSAIAVPNGSKVSSIAIAGDGQAFSNALNWANSEMVRGITFQYLATSEGMHQSRASSETHQDILSLGILRRKHWLANQQRREVYTRLLRYNFDLDGKKIARYVPRLSLGLGDGFPITAQSIAQLKSAGYLDPSQYERIDERIGLPKRELITVNGVKMSPTEKMQMEQQQAAQQASGGTQPAQGAQNGSANGNNNANGAAPNSQASLVEVPNAMKAAPPQTIVIPPSNITINVPEQKTPEIHIDAAMTLPANFSKAIQPQISFQLPAQPPSNITINVRPTPVAIKNSVNVPTQKAPDVIVNPPAAPAPTVNVSLPKEKSEILDIERDEDNRIKRVIKSIFYGDKK